MDIIREIKNFKKKQKPVPVIKGKIHTKYNTSLSDNTIVGKYCSFHGTKVMGKGKVIIGDYFHAGDNLLFLTEKHNYEGEFLPYDRNTIVEDIIVGNYVWMGDNVIVLGDVKIGDGAIIQAGAVVSSDIPECGIAGGNPARVFKYRDIKHFERLKREGKFLKF